MTPEIEMLEKAVVALGDLAPSLIFVGGAVVGLLLTDEAAAMPRSTADIDVLVLSRSRHAYYAVEEQMRSLGFTNDTESDVICRWRGFGLIVDLMPPYDEILGFTNRWYLSAVETAHPMELPSGAIIKVIDGPRMLATKLVAYEGRGNGDLFGSHDLEDIVLLVDGRPELVAETVAASLELREDVASRISRLLENPLFEDAVEGHLSSLDGASLRTPLVISRFKSMATLEE